MQTRSHKTVEDIKFAHRRRRYAMKLQQKIDRHLESFVRLNYTTWEPDADEASRAAQNKKALAIIDAARSGEGYPEVRTLAEAADEARRPADSLRKEHERRMEELAEELVAYKAFKSVKAPDVARGFGALGLATILAEAGAPLEKFPTPGHLWSRLGFAPFGRSDGKNFAGSSWKRSSWHPGEKPLSAEEWTEHPFSGERYALIYAIGDSLFRAQIEGKAKSGTKYGRAKGPYGQIYIARREHTERTHPDWTLGHAHKDALRIMIKALLKDLWLEWNRLAKLADGLWSEAAE